MKYSQEWKALQRGVFLLNKHGATQYEDYPEGYTDGSYNCWGLTAYLLGWDDLTWQCSDEMQRMLEAKTTVIDLISARVGDIVVFRDDYKDFKGDCGLSHTALLISVHGDDHQFWAYLHKPGQYEPEVVLLGDGGTHTYCHPDNISEYRRVRHGC